MITGGNEFRVRNKIFAVIQEDGISLVVKTTKDDRMAFTTMDPQVFSIPPTFTNTNYMIVRMDLVNPSEFHGLMIQAWHRVAPKRLAANYEVDG